MRWFFNFFPLLSGITVTIYSCIENPDIPKSTQLILLVSWVIGFMAYASKGLLYGIEVFVRQRIFHQKPKSVACNSCKFTESQPRVTWDEFIGDGYFCNHPDCPHLGFFDKRQRLVTVQPYSATCETYVNCNEGGADTPDWCPLTVVGIDPFYRAEEKGKLD